MRLADAGRTHQQQTLFRCAWIISHKSLGQEFGFFQRVGLLGCGANVGAVTLEIAMLVALGNVGAFDDSFSAILHAAVAGDGYLAGGTIGPGDELPAGSFAERAIL